MSLWNVSSLSWAITIDSQLVSMALTSAHSCPSTQNCHFFTHPHVQNPPMAPANPTRVPSPQTRSQGFHHLAIMTLLPWHLQFHAPAKWSLNSPLNLPCALLPACQSPGYSSNFAHQNPAIHWSAVQSPLLSGSLPIYDCQSSLPLPWCASTH